MDDIGCFDEYQDFVKLNRWIFSGGILNKVSDQEPLSIETLKKNLSAEDLIVSGPEVVTNYQLQGALPVTQVSDNNSFIPSSTGVNQQLNAFQMQPYYSNTQSISSTSNMYDEYNSKQITPVENNDQKTGFIRAVVQGAKIGGNDFENLN